MILSTKHKFLLLSNAKCASSALRQRFCYLIKRALSELEKERVHSTYDEVERDYCVNLKNFYVFSTIRNPWERMVSLYNYAKPDKSGNEWWQLNPNNIDKPWGGEYDKNTRCSFEYYLKLPHKFRYACRNMETMFGNGDVKIYKTEDLDIDVILDDMSLFNNDIASQISREKLEIIEPNGWHPKKNGIESKNYKEYYTNDSVIEIIANHYKTDIEYGGYVF